MARTGQRPPVQASGCGLSHIHLLLDTATRPSFQKGACGCAVFCRNPHSAQSKVPVPERETQTLCLAAGPRPRFPARTLLYFPVSLPPGRRWSLVIRSSFRASSTCRCISTAGQRGPLRLRCVPSSPDGQPPPSQALGPGAMSPALGRLPSSSALSSTPNGSKRHVRVS